MLEIQNNVDCAQWLGVARDQLLDLDACSGLTLDFDTCLRPYFWFRCMTEVNSLIFMHYSRLSKIIFIWCPSPTWIPDHAAPSGPLSARHYLRSSMTWAVYPMQYLVNRGCLFLVPTHAISNLMQYLLRITHYRVLMTREPASHMKAAVIAATFTFSKGCGSAVFPTVLNGQCSGTAWV